MVAMCLGMYYVKYIEYEAMFVCISNKRKG